MESLTEMNDVKTNFYLFLKELPVILIYGAMVFGGIYCLVTIAKIIRNPAPAHFGPDYVGNGADCGEPVGDGSGDSIFCDLGGFDCGGFDGGGCDGL
jgi:hypothetical protein